MTWNYRVVKTGDVYGVHEVYYDEFRKVKFISEKPILAFDDLEDLKFTTLEINKSTNRKIIDFEDTGFG